MMPSGIDSQQLTQLIRALMQGQQSRSFSGGDGALMTPGIAPLVADSPSQGNGDGGGLVGGMEQGLKAGEGVGMEKLKALMGGMKMDHPTDPGPAPAGPASGGLKAAMMPGAAAGGGAPSIQSTLTPNMPGGGPAKGASGMFNLMKLFGR